ncbi:MAG: hypothetical protein ACN6OI_02180 [Flavobacterium sp.]|jgi:hypothetical protein|uniref:hypothetical protein n=1 Tax=Flavobacterium sp. TaxID=239 RepID=UPI003D0D39B6
MIKKFIFKFLCVFVCFFGLLIVVLLSTSKYVNDKNFKNSQTESNTLIIKSDRKYDLLFMGISHARNFSRYENHKIVEEILNKKMINIGQGGGGCGINEQLFYLQYFYSKGNKADTVVLILTPSMLTSEKLPVASNTFDKEIFDLNFLYQYLFFDSENKYQRITGYSQSKLEKEWINLKPDYTVGKFDSLTKMDKLAVEKGILLARQQNINIERFEKSCFQVEEIIKLAEKNNSKVVFIIPPALFGKWPEHNLVSNYAKKMEGKHGIKFYDFSQAILIPQYYYDHHHLNTKGVRYFTTAYLRPII